jgi:hypothetical protein
MDLARPVVVVSQEILMKKYAIFFPGLPLAIVLVTAIGCSNDSGQSATSGATAPLLSRGIVSTANGVSVNGDSLSLQSATVSIDGETGSSSSLKDGMWVTVERRDGVIQSISYDEDVKGPIDTVELDGSLSVLGQRVHISSSTHFDDSTPGTLTSGDVVEVSGLRDSNDVLAASRIELKQTTAKVWSVRGRVRNLDQSLQVFVIGNLTVDYSQARFDDMSESSLVNGLQVEVKDESLAYEPGSLYLLATKIENHDPSVRYPSSSSTDSGSSSDDSNSLSGDDSSSGSDNDDSSDRTEVEIDGIVTDFDTAAGTLEVEGIMITTANTTQFQDHDDQYVSREMFFTRLRQGVTVVKVKWRPFSGYDQPPHEVEIES